MADTKKLIKWESYHMDEELYKQLMEEGSEEESEVSDFEKDEDTKYGNLLDSIPSKKMIQTPMGFFVVDDAHNPLRKYNFWMAHTNFRITNELAYAIEATDGVDILRIMSPYSFVVACGLAFEWREVRIAIEDTLRGGPANTHPTIKNTIESLKTKLAAKYKEYKIYVYPNGQFTCYGLLPDESNLVEYEKGCQTLKDCQKLSQGLLIESGK